MIITPDRRLRVFVSSTLEELAAERAAARAAVEALRLTPVLFELGARPHPPRDLYKAYLEQSDVFVGIYAERYGWVAPGMEVSGLEDEYLLARGKPQLLYLKRPAPGREERLKAMIDRIREDATVSYRSFHDADELRRLLEDDLAVLLSERFQRQTSTAAPRMQTRLPASVDRFVGRERELTALERQLLETDTRLVVVVGPGGVGKTRLALEAARRVRERFADGAHFVQLGTVADAEHVDAEIRESLEVSGAAAASPLQAIVDRLRDAELLLVLDNFEHVLAAGAVIARLLEDSPRVTVLVTSRSVLKLKGEHDFPLSPLGLPETAEAHSDAVDLFVERACAVSPSFELTHETRAAVVEICRRLDGLPLAIELAAAQVRVLPPQSILERIEQGLALAARAPGPGYPNRQQTLRAAIEWSFGLLDDAEQRLFARASVFRGGWTLDALEVVGADGTDVLELLAALVEKSLVTQEPSEFGPRYSMLQTIGEYAAEQLEIAGESATIRARHASFYLRLVEHAGQQLIAAGHGDALALLDRDDDNVRAALGWLLEQGQLERLVDAAWSLLPYWSLRERLTEGLRWLGDVLERGELSERARGRALASSSVLTFWGSNYDAAIPLATEAHARARAARDDAAIALAQIPLGVAQAMGPDREAGIALLEDSRARAEQLQADWGIAMSMLALSWALNAAGADARLELFEETVARARSLGFESETVALGALARRHALRGDVREAKQLLAEVLGRLVELNVQLGIGLYVDLIADLAARESEDRLAARLSGGAESVFAAAAAPITPLVGDRAERLARLRERLGDAAFEAETAAGRKGGREQAVAEALAWTHA